MKLTNRTFVLTALFAASISLFSACSKSATSTVAPSTRVSASSSGNIEDIDIAIEPTGMCGNAQVVPLTAGQTIPAGTVTIENDADNVYVTYNTSGDWKFQELHLNLKASTNGDCSVAKSSDLAPGQFPYQVVFNTGAVGTSDPTTYTFVVPRATLGASTCFCVYAHSVVTSGGGSQTGSTQTAWGGNIARLDHGKWYGATNYCLQECGDLGK